MVKIITFFIILACIVVIGAGLLYIYDAYFINIRNYESLSCLVGRITKKSPLPIYLKINPPQTNFQPDDLIYAKYFRGTHLADPEKEIESKKYFYAGDKIAFVYTTSAYFEDRPKIILWIFNKDNSQYAEKAMGYIIQPSPLSQPESLQISNPSQEGEYELRVFVEELNAVNIDFQILNK